MKKRGYKKNQTHLLSGLSFSPGKLQKSIVENTVVGISPKKWLICIIIEIRVRRRRRTNYLIFNYLIKKSHIVLILENILEKEIGTNYFLLCLVLQ